MATAIFKFISKPLAGRVRTDVTAANLIVAESASSEVAVERPMLEGGEQGIKLGKSDALSRLQLLDSPHAPTKELLI